MARPRLVKGSRGPSFTSSGPREVQAALRAPVNVTGVPLAKPPTFSGTLPEWQCYWALMRLGQKPGVDFVYQAPWFGGRLTKGGQVADFVLLRLHLILQVQGVFWHYQRGRWKTAIDVVQRAQMQGRGYRVISLDADALAADPIALVRDALRGIDHSRAARGF